MKLFQKKSWNGSVIWTFRHPKITPLDNETLLAVSRKSAFIIIHRSIRIFVGKNTRIISL